MKEKPIEILSNGKKVFAYNENGKAICNSIIRRDGQPDRRCKVTILGLCGRCSKHGSKAPRGLMHFRSRSLKTSENLPAYLRADMNLALEDEDKLSVDHEIALSDTKISQLKKGLGEDLSEAAWKALKTKADLLLYYLNKDQEKVTEEFLLDFAKIIYGGIKEEDTWNKIKNWQEHKRRLTETGSKREKELRLLLRGEQVDAIILGIATASKEHVYSHHDLLAKMYTLTDKNTGKTVNSIDIKYANKFIMDIGQSLGKLIGKSRESQQKQIAEQA